MRNKIYRLGIFAALSALAMISAPDAFAKKLPKSGGTATVPCGDGAITYGPVTLWPPNHKFKSIAISFAETDATSDGDTLSLQVNDISFNQESADDNGGSGCGQPTAKQSAQFNFSTAVVSGPGGDDTVTLTTSVDLRAERCARLGTRVYSIDVSCTDDIGTDDATLTVSEPRSRGRK